VNFGKDYLLGLQFSRLKSWSQNVQDTTFEVFVLKLSLTVLKDTKFESKPIT